VRARQARGRLATTLLAPTVPLQAETSYDISAWSLPYAYGVEAHQTRGSVDAGWNAPVASGVTVVATPDAGYGYLVPAGATGAPGIVDLLRRDVKVRVLSRPATIGGREWSPGSWFLPSRGNSALASRIDSAGLRSLVTPLATGRADAGIDLGSEHVWPVKLPRVGVLTGSGVVPTSFGAQWFFLEQRLGLPFDALLLSDLALLDLSRYDVLVLPDLHASALEPGDAQLFRTWVENGGRLVALAGGASAVAAAFDVTLRKPLAPDGVVPERLLRGRSERLRGAREEEVAGVILEVRVDSAHPLGWGAGKAVPGGSLFVLHAGPRVFEPSSHLETVAHFPAGLGATSGVISSENLKRLELGAWLISRSLGKGSLTLFADDPLFRLFWRETHPLYVNAILVGPGP
jgi:hypothetical protein